MIVRREVITLLGGAAWSLVGREHSRMAVR